MYVLQILYWEMFFIAYYSKAEGLIDRPMSKFLNKEFWDPKGTFVFSSETTLYKTTSLLSS